MTRIIQHQLNNKDMMTRNHIVKLIYEILYEDPDTVFSFGGRGELASMGDGDNISFIIMDMGFEVDYFYGDYGTSPHFKVWDKIKKKYPSKKYWQTGNEVNGRLWPKKKICSIYEDRATYKKYSLEMEKMFKELKLNINEFKFEYGNSSRKGELLSWNDISTGQMSTSSRSKEAQLAKEKLNQLLKNFHLADPIQKKQIRSEMETLRKQMGATEDELRSTLTSLQDKLMDLEKQYGSVAQANYMKGAIAEEKIPLYNKTLHPMFWLPNQKLHPDIRKQLLLIADDFVKNSKLDLQVHDVRFLGSLAGYNYTQSSDIDLHIIVDMKKIGIPEDQIVRFGRGISSKWNDEHDVKIKEHKVEIFIEDISANNRASGIYSLCKDNWLRVPQKQKIRFDKENIKKLYYYFSKKIDDVISTNNLQQMRNVFKQITDIRERGLSSRGEFSIENIVFKILRMKGDIKKLKDATNQQVDKDLSLNESNENKNISSKYFTVKFGDLDRVGKNTGAIYLGDEWFGNTYKMPSDWGDHANRWVFNRHTGAMNRNYPADAPSYPSLENLLKTLDIWYEKNK